MAAEATGMASAEPGDCFQPGVARSIQVLAGDGRQRICTLGDAAGSFVLDVPGDGLPVRSVPRRGTRPITSRVCAVHGVLPRDDFRPGVPHAGYAAAVSLGRTGVRL